MPGNDGVVPETGRDVVASVQRMSDDRPLAASNPFAHQRGLTKAGRRGDEGQFAAQARGGVAISLMDSKRVVGRIGSSTAPAAEPVR